ncbi:DUF6232 family protein [Streptomyces odontomachi]|uniref:DUF6232 family protein n=1 Tax=Streptomyces odontomachi TaxID=2944940 RepID=UPI00210B84C3|nr:DUF6232 family protein [Streptomyces sp. ODS25]
MDQTGTGSIAAPPPDPPPQPAQPPPIPPLPRRGAPLVLRVSSRVLWVGSAAVPLHNITWVDAFKLKGDWSTAALRFVKYLVVAVVVYILIAYTSGDEARLQDAGDDQPPLIIICVLFLAAFRDVFGRKPVLVVETASGSAVIVTLPSVDELRQIAGKIVYAIDNPQAEFSAVVHQYNSNKTNNYGPVVNMNGGRGNTGFKL